MSAEDDGFHAWQNDLTEADPVSEADEVTVFSAAESDLPVFTVDQIADQLSVGYWAPYGGARAFDVSPGGTLLVDLTALAQDGQDMARLALGAWTRVSGIEFTEAAPRDPPASTITEGQDASDSVGTLYLMAVGEDFVGDLATGADRDAVGIVLTAGQTISFAMNGEATDAPGTEDAYLRLLDGTGATVAENDDALGYDSIITYDVTQTGTYYIQAGSFADAYPGGYRISARAAGQPADIVFDDDQSGAFTSSTASGGVIQSSFINISDTWAGGSNRIDGYYFQTYLHEIGHALGLGHAGNYNGSATYGTDNHYLNDSWQASIMSYFHQTENTFVDASFAYAITPMVADIVAIQDVYGPAEAHVGDTIYGGGGNSGTYLDGALDLGVPVAFTVYDTDGIDLFDFSSFTSHQTLDLREEHYSSVAGLSGNVGIARGTSIENGRTGDGDDSLFGNDAGNDLRAGAGHDTVRSADGNDAVQGNAGADDLRGENGRDLLEGGSGNDLLSGEHGEDLLFGDDIALTDLIATFPDWEPPADAATLLEAGDLMVLWEDILSDVFGII